ncbi:DUF3298 domain-containing protein [Lachnoclostridium sp. An14]|uniref:DUF3298 and DUF4163 domain-containing protein n=1 Tax=Lachnoclostridium sp. An14 TaxID=1965562 RepID=UPI000B3A28D5|nr:DUF3298 and DUF4163 domain-containing protein [Lachnoclostridium sp. An14]OUQ11467.1 DUF3298 domain-containing protein [Lachnoclostridium sp. An14]
MNDWKENWRQQYEEIPVPDEAKRRLEEGIRKAKEEKRNVMRLRLIKRVGGTAAAAMVALTVLVNGSPAVAQAMERVPVIGAIAKVVTFRTYEDSRENAGAQVNIPQIEGEGQQPEANQAIEEYANRLIQMYEKEIQAGGENGNYGLDSTYDVVFENQKYVSIRIRSTLTMASGTEFVKVFNVDKATGQVVELKDLLCGDEAVMAGISENIKAQMEAQMAADENVSYFLNSDTPEWDFKGIDGDESYYFNENGQLVIVFEEYEVAPGYMGAVEFVIPESVTGSFGG